MGRQGLSKGLEGALGQHDPAGLCGLCEEVDLELLLLEGVV
jgi:hypothetical protein